MGVRNAMLKALYEVVSKAGANMSEVSRTSILGLIDSDSGDTSGTSVLNAGDIHEMLTAVQIQCPSRMRDYWVLSSRTCHQPMPTGLSSMLAPFCRIHNRLTGVRHRVLTTHFSNASVLSLNSILVESPNSLIHTFAQETPAIICQGISNKDVSRSLFIDKSGIDVLR